MATTKVGDTSYIYGIDTEEAISKMVITGLTKETTPEFEAEATDDTGSVAAVVIGADKISYTISGFLEEGGDLESHGKGTCTITVDSKTCIIDKWSLTKSNNDYSKCEINASTFPEVATGDYCCS